MNTERIRELAKEAGYYLYDLTETHECKTVETDSTDEWITLEKFAELIVRECISINRQRMFLDYEGDSHRVAHNNALLCANSDMFEHFGVEE